LAQERISSERLALFDYTLSIKRYFARGEAGLRNSFPESPPRGKIFPQISAEGVQGNLFPSQKKVIMQK
jgi:hypothetical protein